MQYAENEISYANNGTNIAHWPFRTFYCACVAVCAYFVRPQSPLSHISINSFSLPFLFTTQFDPIRSDPIPKSQTIKIQNFSNIKCQTDIYVCTYQFRTEYYAIFIRITTVYLLGCQNLISNNCHAAIIISLRRCRTFKSYCWLIFAIIISYFVEDFVILLNESKKKKKNGTRICYGSKYRPLLHSREEKNGIYRSFDISFIKIGCMHE